MNAGTGAGTPAGERAEPPGVREALAAEQQATLEQVAGLEREFGQIVAASQSDNADDEHDPEGATIAFERQHVAALLAQARDHLAAIDAALGPAGRRHVRLLRALRPADPAGTAGGPPDGHPVRSLRQPASGGVAGLAGRARRAGSEWTGGSRPASWVRCAATG